MAVQVHTVPGALLVSAPFDLKDALKDALRGARWNKGAKAWAVPPTVGSARNILDFVREHHQTATGDSSFHKLLGMVRAQDEAQAVKAHRCTVDCPKWHHQQVALQFAMNQPGAMLAMDMGTGKTKVALDLIVARGHKRVLVLTKKKAMPVWTKQAAQFAPHLHVARVAGASPQRKVNQMQNAADHADATGKPLVLVVNYESAWRDAVAAWLLNAELDLVVMDESHKIKAPGGKASKFCQQLALVCPCRLPLTGTPMGDKPIDLYGQFRALDAGVFGTSFAKFRERYCVMGGYLGKEILAYRNQDEMMQRAGRFMYVVGSEVLGLLPARHKTYYCQLSSDARRIYDAFADEAFAALADESRISADNVLVKLLRCQQMTGGFVTTDEIDEAASTENKIKYVVKHIDDAKAELLKDVLQDLPDAEGVEANAPVVVYCKFTHDLRAVQAVADQLGMTYGEISGRVDQQDDFKAGAVQVLGCQIQAGGTGVDGLQDVSHVAIYYSTGYSLTDYDQSLKRLDRPGQNGEVLNIHLVAENTIDEDVVEALTDKKDVIEHLMQKARQPQDMVA